MIRVVRAEIAAGSVRDEAAFEALVGPLMEPALRLAYSMLGDRAEAEDATQEAVTRAWRKLHQLRSGMPARPWFLAIVANQCRNVRRTRWFALARVADVFAGRPWTEPAERMDLEQALRRLPLRDREVVFLRFYLDLSIDEIAQTLGVSPGATRVRIHRACARLRPHLAEEEV